MKYFFILGRNPELSIAEIMSYLEKNGIRADNLSVKENSLFIETDGKLDPQIVIKELGGTIALGEVLCSGKKDTIADFIEKNEIYFGEEIKFDYSMVNFADENAFDEILQQIKDKFKAEKLRAFYRSSIGHLDIQEKGFTGGTPSKMKSRDVVYFLFRGTDYSFGEIKAIYDSAETEKRDINKPVRREELAISPRLAKILINLSQVKKNETLIDPFCGIGAVVMESLLQNINAVGIDFNFSAIKGAIKNYQWLKSNYKVTANCEFINDDSRKVRIEKAEGVATEPSLGELLKLTPTEDKAEQMIEDFENLIIDVLNNVKLSLKPGAKIAFTSPLIRTHSGKIGCSINKIMNNTHLVPSQLKYSKNIKFPIREIRKDSIVGREFFVLTKNS